MKKRIVPKTTLILLLFTLLLAWSAVLPGRADSLIKSKEFTTRTFYADGDDDEVEFTENFGFAGDSYLNSGRFRMDITLTPVYNSIWISSDGERANLATEPAIVNLINGRLNARIDTATGGEFQPDYGSDGMIRSFRYSRSDLLSDDLTYANFTVTLPDEYAIESLFYQYGEDLEIDDVQYSVKFKIKVSIYGNAPGIKLKKKVLYGYINDIWYFIDVAELKGGNEKIVKATSSSPSVAVVSASTQRIRLKKVGTSKITLTNGYGRSATFTVKVQSSTITRRVSSDTFCQGCLRTFFAVIQNQTLDFVAHGFFARFTEMDFDAVGGLSDFLYHYRWRGFLYGQRGSGCGGAAVAGVVVHRLSFP